MPFTLAYRACNFNERNLLPKSKMDKCPEDAFLTFP